MTERATHDVDADGDLEAPVSRTGQWSTAVVHSGKVGARHARGDAGENSGGEDELTAQLAQLNLDSKEGADEQKRSTDHRKTANRHKEQEYDTVDGPVWNQGQSDDSNSQDASHFLHYPAPVPVECGTPQYIGHGFLDSDVETDEAPIVDVLPPRLMQYFDGELLKVNNSEVWREALSQTTPVCRGPPETVYSKFSPSGVNSNGTDALQDILNILQDDERSFPVTSASNRVSNANIHAPSCVLQEMTPPHTPGNTPPHQTPAQDAAFLQSHSPPLTPRGTPSPRSPSKETTNNTAYSSFPNTRPAPSAQPASSLIPSMVYSSVPYTIQTTSPSVSMVRRTPHVEYNVYNNTVPNTTGYHTGGQAVYTPLKPQANDLSNRYIPTDIGLPHGTVNLSQMQQARLNIENTRKRKHNEEENVILEVDSDGDSLLHTLGILEKRMVEIINGVMFPDIREIQQYINLQNTALQTPLLVAVMNDNIDMVEYLLQFGANVNIAGKIPGERDTYTIRAPLHLAAIKGDDSIELLMLLLQAEGVDVNQACPGDGLTPLHLALQAHQLSRSEEITHNCRQVIHVLIESGADLHQPDIRSSKTPLMKAIETRDLSVVKDILEGVSNPNQRRSLLAAQTRDGNTCLHFAAGLSRKNCNKKSSLLRLLIQNGADCNIENKEGDFPRDLAGGSEWDKATKVNWK